MKKGKGLKADLQRGLEETENAFDTNQQDSRPIENEDYQKNNSSLINEISAQKSGSNTADQTDKTRNLRTTGNAKKKKQVFSFRADVADIAIWRAYATATGCTMETIGTAALNEYLDRHELEGADLDIFEAMKSKIVDK